MNNLRLNNSKGFSLTQLIVAMGIATLVLLGVAQVSEWSTNSYLQSVEENTAEQNLLMGAFYLREYLSQAVETICYPSVFGLPSPVVLVHNIGVPPYLGEGVIDCRIGHPWPVSPPGNPNALGVFNLERGGVATLVPGPGNLPKSDFVGGGIYFQPPQGTQSGKLFFAQAKHGTRFINPTNSVVLDHFVDIQVQSYQASPGGRLQNISILLTTRYMLDQTPTPNYLPAPVGPTSRYRDINLTVDVALRDNWLGITPGSNTSERVYGGLYFFHTITPPMVHQ